MESLRHNLKASETALAQERIEREGAVREECLRHILEQLTVHESSEPLACAPMPKSYKNQLYRADFEAQSYVLKLYSGLEGAGSDYSERCRAEICAYRELEKANVSVPQYITGDWHRGYAVFAWVEGVGRPASEFTLDDAEMINQEYFAKLLKLDRDTCLLEAVDGDDTSLRLIDQVRYIEGGISRIFREPHPPWLAAYLANREIEARYQALFLEVVARIPEKELAMEADKTWPAAFNPDFASHNILWSEENGRLKKPYFIDFERMGVGHPLKGMANFLAHPQSVGMSSEVREVFVEGWLRGLNTNAVSLVSARLHLQAMTELSELLWSARHFRWLNRAAVQEADKPEYSEDVRRLLENAEYGLTRLERRRGLGGLYT